MIAITRKSQEKLVKQIHDEFDNAQETLLKQALQIINQPTASKTHKAERLKALGFTSTEEVVNYDKTQHVLVKNQEQAELIRYYKHHYPFQKFLTEDELDRICKKYNLIYAPVDRYKKTVPSKNLAEIENSSRLKDIDSPHQLVKISYSYIYSDTPYSLHILLTNGIHISIPEFYKMFPSKFNFHDDNVYSAASIHSNNLLVEITDKLLSYLKQKNIYNGNFNGTFSSWINMKCEFVDRNRLFIAAPKSHFDLKGLKKHKLGFFQTTILEPKDPIVFRYCRGGVQVLTKWGLEANDEALLNEIMN
jgi:hypothetical protein